MELLPSGQSTHLFSAHRCRAPSAAAAKLQSTSAVSGAPVSRPSGPHHVMGAWGRERGAPARGRCCRSGRRRSRRRRPFPLSPESALRRRKRELKWNPRKHAMPRLSLSGTEKTVPLWRRQAPTGQVGRCARASDPSPGGGAPTGLGSRACRGGDFGCTSDHGRDSSAGRGSRSRRDPACCGSDIGGTSLHGPW